MGKPSNTPPQHLTILTPANKDADMGDQKCENKVPIKMISFFTERMLKFITKIERRQLSRYKKLMSTGWLAILSYDIIFIEYNRNGIIVCTSAEI